MAYTNRSSKTNHPNPSINITDMNNVPQRNSVLSEEVDELILPGHMGRRPSITLTCPDKANRDIGSDDELKELFNIPPPSPMPGRKSPLFADSDSEDDIPNGMLRFTSNSYTNQELYDINALTEEELQEMYRLPPPPSPIPGRRSPAFAEAYNAGVLSDNSLSDDSLSDEELEQRFKLPPPPSPIPGRKSPCFRDYNQNYDSDSDECNVVSKSCGNLREAAMDSSLNKSRSVHEIPSGVSSKNLPSIIQSPIQEYKPVYSYRVDLSNVMPQPYVQRYRASMLPQGLNSVTSHVEAPTNKTNEHSSVHCEMQSENNQPAYKEPKDNNGKVKTSHKSKMGESEIIENPTKNSEKKSPKPSPRSVYSTVGTDKVTFNISREPKTTEIENISNYKLVKDNGAIASNESDEDLSLEESLAISALEDVVDESLQMYSCSNEPFNSYDELENMKQSVSNNEPPEFMNVSSIIRHNELANQAKSTGSLCQTDESSDLQNSSYELSRESLDGYLCSDVNSLKNFIAKDEESEWEFSYEECSINSQDEYDTDAEVGTNQITPNTEMSKKNKNTKEKSMGKKLFKRNKENKNKSKSPKSSPNLIQSIRKDGHEGKTSPSRFGSLNIFKSTTKDKPKEEGRITNIDTTGNKTAGWSTSEMEEFLMKNKEQNMKLGMLDEDDIMNRNNKSENITKESSGNWSAEAMEKYLMDNKDTNLKLGLLDQEDITHSKLSGYTHKVAPTIAVQETQYRKKQNRNNKNEHISKESNGNWSAEAMEKYLMDNKDTNLKLGLLDQEDIAHSKLPGYTHKVAPTIAVHETQYIKKQNPISLQEVKDTTDESEGWSKSAMEDYLMQNKEENLRLGLLDEEDVAYNEAKRHMPGVMADPRPTPKVTVHDVIVIDTEKFCPIRQDADGSNLFDFKESLPTESKTKKIAPSPTQTPPPLKNTESWKGPATLQELKASRMAARLQQKSPSPQPLHSSQRKSSIPDFPSSHLEVQKRIMSVSLPCTPKSNLRPGGKSPKSKKAPSIPKESVDTTDLPLTPMKEAIAITPRISRNITFECCDDSPYPSDDEFEHSPQTPMKLAIAASPGRQNFNEYATSSKQSSINNDFKNTISVPQLPDKVATPSKLTPIKAVTPSKLTPMKVAKKNAQWTAKDMERFIMEQDIDQQRKLGFVTDEEVEIDQWKNETGLVPLCDTRWTRESLRQSRIVHASSTDSILSPSPPGSPTVRSPTDSVLSSPTHHMGGIGPSSPKRSKKKHMKTPRSPSPVASQKLTGHLAFRGFKLGKRVMKRALSTTQSKSSSLAGSNQTLDFCCPSDQFQPTDHEHDDEGKPSVSKLEKIGIKLPGLAG
ncbi:unnamed protein product, partial [Meganyctiphanes norvegica]